MTQDQLDGITKARIANSITRLSENLEPFPSDADYKNHVMEKVGLKEFPEEVATSYQQQWKHIRLEELQTQMHKAQHAHQYFLVRKAEVQLAQEIAADAETKVVAALSEARAILDRPVDIPG